MTPRYLTTKTLSGKIFLNSLALALSVILLLSIVITSLYFVLYERRAEEDLAQRATSIASIVNTMPSDEVEELFINQYSDTARCTLIAEDGTVLFDSSVDAANMENHADRPELLEAKDEGDATLARYSDTLEKDTVYAAVQLEDGSFLRLSETHDSLYAFWVSLVFPMLLLMGVAALIVFFISRSLTRRILEPLDALDFSNPLENEIYEEMGPLLIRIDEQQHQLRQQNRELAEAESMRRDFSSNVSHEMKTPLQVISGYAELMKNDLVQPDDRQKFASLIYEEAQAMRSLINDVLTLSKLDESAFSHEGASMIDLYAVAQRVERRLSSFAAEHDVRVCVDGVSASIVGSATLAEEMIYNLIENGIRYSNEGGLVCVTVGVDDVEDGDQTVVIIKDSGTGIPEDMQEKIFERFFRVDKSRSKETGGTGLGLAIVKHAVLHQGGSIEVESALGAGTTFTLRFPAV